jgi:hypothetical protein
LNLVGATVRKNQAALWADVSKQTRALNYGYARPSWFLRARGKAEKLFMNIFEL